MTRPIPNEQVLDEQLADPEFTRVWNETALADAVATVLIAYRAKHQLTQTGLARLLGMRQPAVARLEAGEHTPSIQTLTRLAQRLGIEIRLRFTQDGLQLSA
ncbi:MAG TPA: helix-turn-helix transcriptional regulator [Actinomycetes bacterium]|jgi:DNA-binding XRE family transcriptional regulator|nr:helix-turn-helix transcriptional regulator [Actinomycetes bacterium]